MAAARGLKAQLSSALLCLETVNCLGECGAGGEPLLPVCRHYMARSPALGQPPAMAAETATETGRGADMRTCWTLPNLAAWRTASVATAMLRAGLRGEFYLHEACDHPMGSDSASILGRKCEPNTLASTRAAVGLRHTARLCARAQPLVESGSIKRRCSRIF